MQANVQNNLKVKAKRCLVLGLGNILLSDEGIGVRVVEQLQKLELPEHVELVDGGTASLDVLLLRPNFEKLVVIDALKAGKEAGTIYRAQVKGDSFAELEAAFDSVDKISLHQIGLVEALNIAKKMNCGPQEVVIIGIEPQSLKCGLELTETIKAKLPEIINAVRKEL